MEPHEDCSHWADLVIGNHDEIPLLGGSKGPYINLDNASSTPPLKQVFEKAQQFMKVYASVGRGAGYKSQLSTTACRDARKVIAHFLGADRPDRVVIFTKQTTEGINKVASRLSLTDKDVIITTSMEHHANLLPWREAAERSGATLVCVDVHPGSGLLMVERLFEALEQYRYSTKLVAITGASNVTGYMPPLREIARAVHAYGGYLLVDGAQLVPHCRVDVGTREDPECIDFLAFSGHKMYAPYGAGALVGPREFFEEGIPEEQGGGAVELVSHEFILWKSPPAKEEVGSPNALGIVAMAVAAKVLMELGMDCVSDHERQLTRYALRQLKKVLGLQIHGTIDLDEKQDRIGVFAFQIKNIHHNLISAILGHEFGIATRSGGFCAHPYVFQLLGVQPQVIHNLVQEIQQEKRTDFPGIVRASLGLYNTFDDIDAFVDALRRIVKGRYQGNYVQDSVTGDFVPLNVPAEFHFHFHL